MSSEQPVFQVAQARATNLRVRSPSRFPAGTVSQNSDSNSCCISSSYFCFNSISSSCRRGRGSPAAGLLRLGHRAVEAARAVSSCRRSRTGSGVGLNPEVRTAASVDGFPRQARRAGTELTRSRKYTIKKIIHDYDDVSEKRTLHLLGGFGRVRGDRVRGG